MASTLNLNTQTHTHTLLSQRPGLQSNSFVKGNPASAAASDTMAVQKEVRDQVVFSSFLMTFGAGITHFVLFFRI